MCVATLPLQTAAHCQLQLLVLLTVYPSHGGAARYHPRLANTGICFRGPAWAIQSTATLDFVNVKKVSTTRIAT